MEYRRVCMRIKNNLRLVAKCQDHLLGKRYDRTAILESYGQHMALKGVYLTEEDVSEEDAEIAAAQREAMDRAIKGLHKLELLEQEAIAKRKYTLKPPLKAADLKPFKEMEVKDKSRPLPWILQPFLDDSYHINYDTITAFAKEILEERLLEWVYSSVTTDHLALDIATYSLEHLPMTRRITERLGKIVDTKSYLNEVSKDKEKTLLCLVRDIYKEEVIYQRYYYVGEYIQAGVFRAKVPDAKMEEFKKHKITVNKETHQSIIRTIEHLLLLLEKSIANQVPELSKKLEGILKEGRDIEPVLTFLSAIPTLEESFGFVCDIIDALFGLLSGMQHVNLDISSRSQVKTFEYLAESLVVLGKSYRKVNAYRRKIEHNEPLELRYGLFKESDGEKAFNVLNRQYEHINEMHLDNIKKFLWNKEKTLKELKGAKRTSYSKYYIPLTVKLQEIDRLLKNDIIIGDSGSPYALPYRLLPAVDVHDGYCQLNLEKFNEYLLDKHHSIIAGFFSNPFEKDDSFLKSLQHEKLKLHTKKRVDAMMSLYLYKEEDIKYKESLDNQHDGYLYVEQFSPNFDRFLYYNVEKTDIFIQDIGIKEEHDTLVLIRPPAGELREWVEHIKRQLEDIERGWDTLYERFIAVLESMDEKSIRAISLDIAKDYEKDVVLKLINFTRILYAQYPFKMVDDKTAILYELAYTVYDIIKQTGYGGE